MLRYCHQVTKWSSGLLKQHLNLDPVNWGREKLEESFVPLWSDLPDASEACRELINCFCKKKCSGKCKYKKNAPSCTELCACSRQCATL